MLLHIPNIVLCLVTQSCPTLCDPVDCSLPGSSVHGILHSPGKNTEVGCHALLQGIFLTPGSNPTLLHCRWILYHLSHQGSPFLILIYIIIIVTLRAILIYNFNLINIWILILKLSSYFCIFYIFLLQIAFVCSTFPSTFLKLGIWRHTVCVISFIHPTPQCDFFK